MSSYMHESVANGERLAVTCRGIAELIAHARLKSFPQVLGAFLYGYCPFDEMAFWVQSEERAPLLIHSEGGSTSGKLLREYIDRFFRQDKPVQETARGSTGVFRCADLSESALTPVAGLQDYFSIPEYKDEVFIAADVADDARLIISLGRKQALGEITRGELRRLQELFEVLDALLKQYWIAQGAIQSADCETNPLESALSSFGQGILTKREQQISSMILQGHSSRTIAGELNISIGTVKVHRKNIHNRMRIRSQRDLFQSFLTYFYSRVAA